MFSKSFILIILWPMVLLLHYSSYVTFYAKHLLLQTSAHVSKLSFRSFTGVIVPVMYSCLCLFLVGMSEMLY